MVRGNPASAARRFTIPNTSFALMAFVVNFRPRAVAERNSGPRSSPAMPAASM
jgi:hypothetical protein